jgi:hypothetical protein
VVWPIMMFLTLLLILVPFLAGLRSIARLEPRLPAYLAPALPGALIRYTWDRAGTTDSYVEKRLNA